MISHRRQFTDAMKTLVLVFALPIGIALGVPCTAVADTYAGTFFPDANPHTACWMPNPATTGIPNPLWAHIFGYMPGSLHDQTGINVQWNNTCDNQTDMRLDDRLNDPNYYGRTTCQTLSGTKCSSWNVMINYFTINPAADAAGFSRASVQQYNWCHEVGHSLGLGHEFGCMVTGVRTANAYSTHQITHIDAQFN